MDKLAVQSALLSACLRANPDYELLDIHELDPATREALSPLQHDPHLRCVLRPRRPGLRPKAVDASTAALLAAMAVPRAMTREFADSADGADGPAAILRLVLDGLLEFQKPDGTFVSGANAYCYFTAAGTTPPPDNISHQALQYGARLHIEDPQALADRLYCYNRRPHTRAWLRRWPTSSALLGMLTSQIEDLEQYWVAVPPSARNPGWFVWHSRSADGPPPRLTYKLYIAPHVEDLPVVIRCAFPLLAACGATSVKVGNSAVGLLRPDKLVAYFPDAATLQAAVAGLVPRLPQVSVQAVPFTCAIDASDLLSWSIDPPHDPARLPWEGESWRRWVTMRLALALVDAQQVESPIPPWQYARERVRLDGINPDTWNPEGVFA